MCLQNQFEPCNICFKLETADNKVIVEKKSNSLQNSINNLKSEEKTNKQEKKWLAWHDKRCCRQFRYRDFFSCLCSLKQIHILPFFCILNLNANF